MSVVLFFRPWEVVFAGRSCWFHFEKAVNFTYTFPPPPWYGGGRGRGDRALDDRRKKRERGSLPKPKDGC